MPEEHSAHSFVPVVYHEGHYGATEGQLVYRQRRSGHSRLAQQCEYLIARIVLIYLYRQYAYSCF